ncbi:MAG: bifunctional ADP-dependent NAD(P)H-hydrate dehydratase/NAD(P)H-hydrate epimerase [Thermoprotei archaeon]|nr:MAG: bifunctional ADP-dependent NAD(P)H-hydrate dehydratase/NAD(P)H-hydrate epimerase [Thermoprotei archaeon]
MRTVSTHEMRALELNAEFLGVDRLTLMENAGRAVADQVESCLGSVEGAAVLVVAGPGNNGGDGFVAARHLACRGAKVSVVLLARPEDIRTDEARVNYARLRAMMVSVRVRTAKDAEALEGLRGALEAADVIVDAMLGTGLKGEVREPMRSAITMVNESRALKVAVDVPSGLNPDTGEIHGVAVRADVTVTFHAAKPGLLVEAAKEYVGKLVVADIGIPREAELVVGPGDFKLVVKPRPRWSHKGDFGRILVVGGSKDFSGAPALSALAALRAGADLAVVASPSSVAQVIRSFSPNLIVRPLPGDYLAPSHVEELTRLARKSTCVVVGPGLGMREETVEAVVELISRVKEEVKLVVDADGIKAVAKSPSVVSGGRVVLTPHAGEFKLLTGAALSEEPGERSEAVAREASRLGAVLLVKGHYDVISDGERVKINVTGNPAMTAGGTGDVLSGLLAAIASWTDDLFRAACVSALVNGLAGDMAAERLGNHLTATDLIEHLPAAFRELGEGVELSLGYHMLRASRHGPPGLT